MTLTAKQHRLAFDIFLMVAVVLLLFTLAVKASTTKQEHRLECECVCTGDVNPPGTNKGFIEPFLEKHPHNPFREDDRPELLPNPSDLTL